MIQRDENARLAALKRYNILDTLPEEDLDAVVRLASGICQTPIAMISLIDEERQWFKSVKGLDIKETHRNISFCQYAIDGTDVYEVENATENPLFTENPLVTGSPDIRFYAGAPLTSPEGYNIGTLCVIDTHPKTLNEEQKTALQVLSRFVISQFELRKTKTELEESKKHYKEIVEKASDIIYTCNVKGEFTFISPAVEKITGYKAEELLGKMFTYLVAPEQRDSVSRFYFEQFSKRVPETRLEFRIVLASGSYKWVEQTVTMLFQNGSRHGFHGIVRDIDERKEAQEDLAAANRAVEEVRKSFQSVLDNTDSVIAIKDMDCRYMIVNKKFEQVYGILNEALRNKTDYDFRPKALADELRESDLQVINSRKLIRFEQEMKTLGGTIFFSVAKFPLYDEEGNMNAFCLMATDITERKKTEQILREKDEKFTKVFHQSPAAMLLFLLETGQVIEVNQSWCELTGYTEKELLEMRPGEYSAIPPEERARLLDEFRKTGKVSDSSLEITDKQQNKKSVIHWSHVIEIGGVKHGLVIFYDITEQKRLEAAISERDARFSVMFHSSPVAMMLGSMHPSAVLEMNKSFSMLTGFSQEELLGKNFAEAGILSADVRDEMRRLFEQRGFLRNEELRISDKSGTIRHVLFSAEIIELNGHRYTLSVYHDISRRKMLEQQLIVAKEEAEESGKAKEQFLANMSHEIRTPMNAVLGFTDLLSETQLDNSQKEFVNAIKTSGRSLMTVINDVLDYSKIEAGMLTIENVSMSIRSIFSSLKIAFRRQAEKKGLKLNFTSDKKIPEVLSGDPERLTQIITNLVGNAIKFTNKGGIDVHAKLIENGGEKVRIRFTVKDTGIGIPEDKVGSVFERFNQGSNDTTRNYGGTGLGLSIVKKLAELQGGTVSVESKPAKGSLFIVEIPYSAAIEEAVPEQKADAGIKIQDPGSVSILLVEDNRLNQKLAEKILEGFGFKTTIASNGKIAVDKIRKGKFDLVLMDMQMPEMNGYEATVVIRNELKSNIPIIAMTAHAMATEREKCLQLGMNDYLPKPFRKEDLYQKITAILKTGSAPAETKKKAPVKKAKAVLDLTYLEELAAGSTEFIDDVLTIFVTDVPEEMKKLEAGVAGSDFSVIKNVAHKMKSAMPLVGLGHLQAVLVEMEALAMEEKGMPQIRKNFRQLKTTLSKAFVAARQYLEK